MASVARGHGGDGAGDPPVPYWKPESGCLASGKKLRSYAKNLELERLRKDNNAPLDIEFDVYDQMMFLPVGTYAKKFKALVGTLARSVPYYYNSWEHVPAEEKAHVWPCLEYFFNLSPYIHERPPKDMIRDGVKNGVDRQFLKAYRNNKARFKGKYFTDRGGARNEAAIRGQPPSNKDPRDWNKHVDFYMSEGAQRLSEVNKSNMSLQDDIATQGRRSYAEIRQDILVCTRAYSLVGLNLISIKMGRLQAQRELANMLLCLRDGITVETVTTLHSCRAASGTTSRHAFIRASSLSVTITFTQKPSPSVRFKLCNTHL